MAPTCTSNVFSCFLPLLLSIVNIRPHYRSGANRAQVAQSHSGGLYFLLAWFTFFFACFRDSPISEPIYCVCSVETDVLLILVRVRLRNIFLLYIDTTYCLTDWRQGSSAFAGANDEESRLGPRLDVHPPHTGIVAQGLITVHQSINIA
jgi:hypothetical protein